ncbi:MAG TPA: ROK family protein [Terriglobia bacterium]|nr:ROK family protein [Terriglobia bacterium]
MNNVLAVDIGGTHFRTGLFDEQGRRLVVAEGDTDPVAGRDWMLSQIADRSRELIAQTDAPVKACGLSFGGPVDFLRQSVTSVHASGWQGFELKRWVEETLGVPCRLDNDANAGALGEYHYGAGRGAKSLVYVTISTGIGSGIIHEGRLLRGKDYLAGELGHVPVSDSGARCSCGGRGCLESFSSARAIETRAREWAERRPERVERMIELSGGGEITARGLMLAAAEGDVAATHILRETVRWLARGLMMIIRILNPDVIVLGGGVAQSGTLLLDTLHSFLDEFASPTIKYSTEIVTAMLGNYSPLYGAAAMALANF